MTNFPHGYSENWIRFLQDIQLISCYLCHNWKKVLSQVSSPFVIRPAIGLKNRDLTKIGQFVKCCVMCRNYFCNMMKERYQLSRFQVIHLFPCLLLLIIISLKSCCSRWKWIWRILCRKDIMMVFFSFLSLLRFVLSLLPM